MPNDTEPRFVPGLISTLTSNFNNTVQEYNEVYKMAQKIESQNKEAANRNPIIHAYQMTLMNRLGAVQNIAGLRNRAAEGFQWCWYFAMNKSLEKDVQNAGKAWLAQQIWPSMSWESIQAALKKAPSVLVTSTFTTQADVDRLKNVSKERVQQEMRSLALSTTASLSIGKLLKTAGSFAHKEGTKLLTQALRRTWQVTGVLAFAHALGRVHDSMEQSEGFDKSLRDYRDKFNASEKSKYKDKLNNLTSSISEDGKYE